MSRRQIEVPAEDGSTVLFEVDDAEVSEELQLASPDPETLTIRVSSNLHTIMASVGPLVSEVRRVLLEAAAADSVEVELGMKLTGETSVVFVKGAAEAHINVKINWNAK